MYHTIPSSSHNPGGLGRSFGLSVHVHDRRVHRSQISHLPSHNHGGLYIFHSRFPRDFIPRSVIGENIQNIHQGCFLYPDQNHYYHPYPIMSPHSHPIMSPHPHPSIPSQPIFLCPHFTCYPIYAHYVVLHHPFIPSLGYLYFPLPSFLPS